MNNTKKSIILIGMPGSGKSEIAQILSQKLQIKVIDIDKEIISLKQKTISQIFEEEGETTFRKYESEFVLNITTHCNTIVSTGGGIILSNTNMLNLSKNGIIFFLDRSIENILNSANLNDRPLIQNDRQKLINLYNNRIDLYNKYADYKIQNNGTLAETVDKIIEIYLQIQ